MMPSFAYRAYLSDGASETGVLEATNSQEAARMLARKGMRPYQLSPTSTSRRAGRSALPFLELSRPIDPGRLFSDISVLLDAGFTVDRALAATIASEQVMAKRQALQKTLDLTTAGRPVAEAFANMPNITPDVVALLASGERSGKLTLVCQRLAEMYDAKAKRRSAILEALTYPAFLLVVMAGALLVLATVLVPALEPIFESNPGAKPLTVKLLAGLGTALTEYPFVFPSLALILLGIGLIAVRSHKVRSRLAAGLTRLPVVGTLLRNITIARYLETLSLLLGNGVSMTEALRLSTAVSNEDALRSSLTQIEDDVANGSRLHDAFAKAKVFDNATVSLTTLGEDANALTLMLDRAARLLQTKLSKRIETLLKLLTPTLTICLGLLVGSLVISVMTTILSINDLALK